ncbi:MAG: helix-turn-helix transcriptional regulator [Clostridia bacterium]|nr:helix-turn-helix transcriptional regulator [Clostridia bacterium]
MNLGENIYQFRTARGLSQGALAEAMEVSRQSISKWENNSAVPELDKLIKMSRLFDITLDELVYGKSKPTPPAPSANQFMPMPSARLLIGCAMLLFGMVFFLLSVFWGDHLRFGEEFGELVSLCIVLLSIALLATYNHKVLAICAVIYFLYGVVCTGILHVSSMASYAFMFLMGLIILFWFICLGLRLTKGGGDHNADSDAV